MKVKNLVLALLLLTIVKSSHAQIPSFPCAAGFGAKSVGGRGGRVIYVTNTNDSGAGSLREACEASGSRTVLFKVSGLISLKSRLHIRNPYITIAGQTAPGDGICIRGGQLSVNTHDVIIRYIRSRAGDNAEYNSGINPDNRDCFEIANQTTAPYNVIFDHCSASWGIDETMSTWYPCKDITIQWSILGEALHSSLHTKGAHGKGLLIGDGARNISIHNNLFAYNHDRNPMIKGSTTTEIVNNVVAGWGGESHNSVYIGLLENEGHTPLQPTFVNLIGNTFIPGPGSFSTYSARANGNMDASSKLFIKDNIGPGRLSTSDPELNILRSSDRGFASNSSVVSGSTVSVSSSSKAYNDVLESSGANYPKRDAVDVRIVNNVKNKTGKIINSQTEVGGWPAYTSVAAPTDSDNDGIPNNWETSKGLNPSDASDGNKLASNGYTWLEEYINSLTSCQSLITGRELSTEESFPISLQSNPIKAELMFISQADGEIEYSIFSSNGSAVQAGSFTHNGINVEKLASGLYMIKVKKDKEEHIIKFIKE